MSLGRDFARRAAVALIVAAAPLSATLAQESTPLGDRPAAPPAAEPHAVQGSPAAEGLPPPILPAPDMPGEDPLVALPPKGQPAAPPVGQIVPLAPGLPLTAQGTLFSFADLAAGLLDSVVYISTSQRVGISRDAPGATPTPDAPMPAPSAPDAQPGKPKAPGDEFFEDFFNDNPGKGDSQPRTVQSLGSGFLIDPSGLIVTNNHVIAEADQIIANLGDGRKFTATVIGIDDKTDLALLKVSAPTPLKAVKFGRSENLRVGDWVLAIGNPFGFSATVTAGIVSALDRDINSGPYDHYIQTDASINRGNSGGPLFNVGGEVVGINTAIMSPTGGSIGIGFAVPAEIAVPVIEQLRQFGEVRRGWIGVRIQDPTGEVDSGAGADSAGGALIAGLNPGGPAEKGGMKAGDLVVEFNGKPVNNMRALPRAVADVIPGKTAQAVVIRDGKRMSLSIEVGLLQPVQAAQADKGPADIVEPDPGEPGADQPDADQPDSGDLNADEPPADGPNADTGQAVADAMFGLDLAPLTDDARKTFAIKPGVAGVLVAGVEPGSEAEDKDVKPGDVIVQVSTKPVARPQDVDERIGELKGEGRRTVMFLLASGPDSKMRFVSLRFDAP